MYRCLECGSHSVIEVPEDQGPGQHRGGPTPYGFLVVDGRYRWAGDASSQVVSALLKLRTAGWTYRDIATWLNEAGLRSPTGRAWNYGSVARVFKQAQRLAHAIPFQEMI